MLTGQADHPPGQIDVQLHQLCDHLTKVDSHDLIFTEHQLGTFFPVVEAAGGNAPLIDDQFLAGEHIVHNIADILENLNIIDSDLQ